MAHSIKVSDQAYEDLRELQTARETYSQIIERLLAIVKPVKEAADILGPSHYLKGDLSPRSRELVEYATIKTKGD